MNLLPSRQAAHIAHTLDELLPCHVEPILILRCKETNRVDIMSHLPPRAIIALINRLHAEGQPDEVDIIRGRTHPNG